MKHKIKTEEWEVTEKEFYAATDGMPKLHEKKSEDGKSVEYELFGMNMSDPIKYKNFRKEVDGKEVDAFCVVKTVQQEQACGQCHIKINTDYHDSCPQCGVTIREMMEKNTKFNDGCDAKKKEMGERFQKEYTKFLEDWCIECDVDIDSITKQ